MNTPYIKIKFIKDLPLQTDHHRDNCGKCFSFFLPDIIFGITTSRSLGVNFVDVARSMRTLSDTGFKNKIIFFVQAKFKKFARF